MWIFEWIQLLVMEIQESLQQSLNGFFCVFSGSYLWDHLSGSFNRFFVLFELTLSSLFCRHSITLPSVFLKQWYICLKCSITSSLSWCLFRVLPVEIIPLTDDTVLLVESVRRQRPIMTLSHTLSSLLLGLIETTASCWKCPAVQAVKCNRSCV